MQPHPREEQKQITPNQNSTLPKNRTPPKKTRKKNNKKRNPNSPNVHNASDAS